MFDSEYIYAIGGHNGIHLNDIERYDDAADKWDTIVIKQDESKIELSPRFGSFCYQLNENSIIITGG